MRFLQEKYSHRPDPAHPAAYWKVGLPPTKKSWKKKVTEGRAEDFHAPGTQRCSEKFGCNFCSRGAKWRNLLKWEQTGSVRIVFGTYLRKLRPCFSVPPRRNWRWICALCDLGAAGRHCGTKRCWGWWLLERVYAGASVISWLCLQAAKTTNGPIIAVIIGEVKKMGCIYSGPEKH